MKNIDKLIAQAKERFKKEFKPAGFSENDPVCFKSIKLLKDFLEQELLQMAKEVAKSVPSPLAKPEYQYILTYHKELKEWQRLIIE